MQPQPPSILQNIIATKQREIVAATAQMSFHDLEQQAQAASPVRDFAASLRQDGVRVIAEIKQASPSKGIICQNFDPVQAAQGYANAGAACLSVLTDREYFKGADEYLQQARAACDLPALRKDFMIAPYQIVQSRALGADCVLLIMACLSDAQAAELYALALELGMSVLIECHDAAEVERALRLPAHRQTVYGINNRNLHTFVTDLATTERLRTLFAPEQLLVTESGIHSAADVTRMLAHGINGFLIGEQFMKTDDAGAALAQLLNDVSQ